MAKPLTLVDALDIASTYESIGFSHLAEERQPIEFVSHSTLAKRARRFATALLVSGVRSGDRVAIIVPDSAQFIEALFGCLYAGIIAVPIYPPMNLPQLDLYLDNTAHILARAGCRMVVTDARVKLLLGTLHARVAGLRSIEDQAALVERAAVGAEPQGVQLSPDSVAFLQFTSGSTARPKGVTLTHAQLLANIDCIGSSLGTFENDGTTAVSWLPLYHDMGLIGFVFAPVRLAVADVLFISPLLFLKRPSLWLRQLSQRKARVTFAPNFAYGLCATRIRDAELIGVDLSSVAVAGCGAEPIQRATLELFATRFAPYGFRSTALRPCYGLAEHSLAASFSKLGEPLQSDRVLPMALASGEALPAEEAAQSVDVVSCGGPLPGHEIRITDDQQQSLADGKVGHIELRGPSVMLGYWDDPVTTREVLRDGWLRTGDLGYLKEGQLYVCGRQKDLIIIQGRNFYPSDIEWQAGQVAGVRRGNVVAFGIQDTQLGRERVIVAAEVRDPSTSAALQDEVKSRVLAALSLRVDEVVLLPLGSLPKTSSGKLQRRKTVDLYRKGELGRTAGKAGKIGLLRQIVSSQWGYLKAKTTMRDTHREEGE